MRAATGWQDYEILDCSGGEKLERWGDVTLIRPDPQVIWNTPKDARWRRADNARTALSAPIPTVVLDSKGGEELYGRVDTF